jgi:hypothetical protein
LNNDARLSEYDDMFASIRDVHVPGQSQVSGMDHGRTRHMAMKGLWPTAAREFVLCTTSRELPSGALALASRTPKGHLEMHPLHKGHVRGIIHVSGYLIQPVAPEPDGSHSEVDCTLVSHVDLGGTIPSSMLNMLSSSAPVKILTAIKKIVE